MSPSRERSSQSSDRRTFDDGLQHSNYFPVLVYRALHLVGCSVVTGYYVSYSILATAGVAILFYIINEMPLSLRWKKIAFFLLVTQSAGFTIGIIYTYVRFATPFALFLWVCTLRRTRSLFLGSSIAIFMTFCISPEMGIALGAGVSVYYILDFKRKISQLAMLLLSPVTACIVFILAFGRTSLTTLTQFGHGTFNFVVQPLPYILIFLIAAIWLVTQTVARSLCRADAYPRIVGLYVIAMTVLPAALGRADPMHVIANGFGLFLLSFLAITHSPIRFQRAWVCAMAFVCGFTQLVGAMDYEYTLHAILPGYRKMLAVQVDPPKWLYLSSQSVDIDQIRRVVGDSKIATPVMVASNIERQLRDGGFTSPSYYAYLTGVWDKSSELRKVNEMDRSDFALIPDGPIKYWESPEF